MRISSGSAVARRTAAARGRRCLACVPLRKAFVGPRGSRRAGVHFLSHETSHGSSSDTHGARRSATGCSAATSVRTSVLEREFCAADRTIRRSHRVRRSRGPTPASSPRWTKSDFQRGYAGTPFTRPGHRGDAAATRRRSSSPPIPSSTMWRGGTTYDVDRSDHRAAAPACRGARQDRSASPVAGRPVSYRVIDGQMLEITYRDVAGIADAEVLGVKAAHRRPVLVQHQSTERGADHRALCRAAQ